MAILAVVVAALLAACSPAATPRAAPTETAADAAPSATLVPSVRPTAGGRLPESQQVVEPGTYTWDEFTPHIALRIAGPGWQVGHRHAEYFDLFPVGSDPSAGPGIGFGRFDFVHGKDGPVPMTNAVAVVAALEANPRVRVARMGPASLAGLAGLVVDVRVTQEQTPLFDGRGGTFNSDPGWVARYQLLDVEGGVLAVSVMSHEDRQAADLVTAAPIIDGLRLAD